MAEEIKYPPILKRTPYVGSAGNRVVHKTDRECSRARDINPNERWYIKEIPQDGNYSLCPVCFGEAHEAPPQLPAVPEAVQKPKRESRFRGLFARAADSEPVPVESVLVAPEETRDEQELPAVGADVPRSRAARSGKKAAAPRKTPLAPTIPTSTPEGVVKKAAVKKAVAKTAAKKAAAGKKPAAKKTSPKTGAKKAPAGKKAAAPKSAPKTVAKKAVAKKPALKKAVIKKPVVQKTTVKKSGSKKK